MILKINLLFEYLPNSRIEDQACGPILENVNEDILNFIKNKLKI